VKVGQKVMVLPSGWKSSVKGIWTYDGTLQEAISPSGYERLNGLVVCFKRYFLSRCSDEGSSSKIFAARSALMPGRFPTR